ncbi:FAD-binding protein [Mesobaculum littorinae]|uniref:D-lactate dehydrogenase (cytochrome) n=1 Tax=Mesobaculum littorinae TaxID=2486419 RepID=A0A438AJ45_9RHOB|nr:FAD-linked oxidase C-terminal domain-containing protein [Mesobaculum littorinae]RVV98627.1 FAD-binding protein [Mesobaculum littorinae]
MPIPAALDKLTSLLGDRLVASKAELDQHSRSETHFAAAAPDAVAYPETTEEVQALVRICGEHGLPVTAWGAGTSLEAQALATSGGVVVDFARMAAILEINPEDMDVRVQPGITRETLNTELRATGLFFPVDPGANASIGGMAMTRASGTTAVRYGTMRDNVMGLEVVLADGRAIRTGSRARKTASGYDLTGLMVGSEGTLGLVTELTLKLHGQPEAVSSAVCAFADIGPAVEAVIATIQSGINMARIEFLDSDTVAACNAASKLGLPETPHLMVEFHGSEAAVAEEAARFGEIAEEFGATGFAWSTLAEERNRLWAARHQAYWSILQSRPGTTAIVTDICVPLSRLAQAVEETRADIAASPIPGPILGHVGDGNFHAILLVRQGDAEEMRAAEALSARMADRALSLGGTVTGEHGVGLGKLGYMEREHGEGWAVMAELKRALDPGNLLNPGKTVRL